MDNCSEPSSDEDNVVIAPWQSTSQISKDVIAGRRLEHSANNNNDVSLAKTLGYKEEETGFQNHCSTDARDFIESNENQSNIFSDHQEDLSGFGYIANLSSSRKSEDDEKMKRHLDEKDVHSTLTTQRLFPKNNSFPLGHRDSVLLLNNESSVTGSMHNNKRLLPPINKIATKRKHILSESNADQVEFTGPPCLPTIEGSPIKAMDTG